MTPSAGPTQPRAEDQVASVVEAVAARRQAWVDRSVRAKLDDLLTLTNALTDEGPAWAQASCRIRGVDIGGETPHMEAIAWLPGVAMLGTSLNALIRSYRRRADTGSWARPPATRQRADGQQVVRVFPTTILDRLYSPGYRGELWLEPGAEVNQGGAWNEGGAVCAILGAGNYEAPIDILTKMFGENRVVIYKPNPVNEQAALCVERMFASLIEAGFLAIVRGGAELGGALVNHAAVDEVLMTGGVSTYDRIVWGPPNKQAANKRDGKKQLSKRFDAELGGAMPVIVVPGRWKDKELEHHAAQIAATKVLNGSHICASPQVVVVDRAWPQRDEFLHRIRTHLAATPPDPSYYPGAAERQAELAEAHAGVETLAPPSRPFQSQLDRLLIPDAQRDARIVQEEAFCPVLAELAVEGGDPASFLEQAISFCNDELFGSLAATLLVDPRTARSLGPTLDESVARLEYGAIGVNVWGMLPAFFGELAWGAFPKHTPEDIQSGVGKIGNGYLLDRVQKAVLWSPFLSLNHFQPARRRDLKVWPRMAHYCVRPSVGRLTKLVSAALFGV